MKASNTSHRSRLSIARLIASVLVTTTMVLALSPIEIAGASPSNVHIVTEELMTAAMGDAQEASAFAHAFALRDPTADRISAVLAAVPEEDGGAAARAILDSDVGTAVFDYYQTGQTTRLVITEVAVAQPGLPLAVNQFSDSTITPTPTGFTSQDHFGDIDFENAMTTPTALAPGCEACGAVQLAAGLILATGCGAASASAGALTEGAAYAILCGGGVIAVGLAMVAVFVYCNVLSCPSPNVPTQYAFFVHTETYCRYSDCTSDLSVYKNGFSVSTIGSSIQWVYATGSPRHCDGGYKSQSSETFTWSLSPKIAGNPAVYEQLQSSPCFSWTNCSHYARISITATFSGGANRLQTTGYFNRPKLTTVGC